MTDTQSEIVVAVPLAGIAPRRAHRAWAIPMAAVGSLLLAVIIVSTFVLASKFDSIVRPYAVVPSDAQDAKDVITLEDIETYPVDGVIKFVTIRQPELPLLSWFMFRKDDISPLTYADIYGDGSPQQLRVRGQRQMISAQQKAEYAALSKLGYPVELKPGAVIIDFILCLEANADNTECVQRPPSAEVLQADDKIVSLDGITVNKIDDLSTALDGKQPGDRVAVEFERGGLDGIQKGEIELIESPDEPGRVLIGFQPFDSTTVGSLPFPIEYSTDGIGGPSAGLAFALTIIDELTLGSLTGGNNVAVTGTIDTDGSVGAIGGLAQKASAVMQTGTRYFIVPASQGEASLASARSVVGDDVEIIPVATLDEALEALAELGGNADQIGEPGKGFVPAS